MRGRREQWRRILVKIWQGKRTPAEALQEVLGDTANGNKRERVLTELDALAARDHTVGEAEEEIACILTEGTMSLEPT